MGWRRLGRLVVTVHSSESPRDEEWHDYIKQADAVLPLESQRILVISAGGAPSALQREEMTNVLGGAKVPVVILTNSLVMRGAGIAVSWFNPSLKVFGPNALIPTFEHLQLNRWERVECIVAGRDLQTELGVTLVQFPADPEAFVDEHDRLRKRVAG